MKTVQDRYLDGHKTDAAAPVPQELVDGTSLVGSVARVQDRLAALRVSGVTTVDVSLPQATREQRLRTVEQLRALADAHGPRPSRRHGRCRAGCPVGHR